MDWSITCSRFVSVQFSVLHRLTWSTDLQTLQNLKLPTRWALFPVPFRSVSLSGNSGSHMYVEPPSVYLLLHLSSCVGMCVEVRTVSRSWFSPGCFCLPVCILTHFDHSICAVYLGVWFSLLPYKLDNWYFIHFFGICVLMSTLGVLLPPGLLPLGLHCGGNGAQIRLSETISSSLGYSTTMVDVRWYFIVVFHVLIDRVDFLGKRHSGPCHV